MVRKIQSPETGRKIIVGGPTYNRLAKEGKLLPKTTEPPLLITLKNLPTNYVSRRSKLEKGMAHKAEGRGSRTRGWAAAAPQRGKERQQLFQVCGPVCFLEPNTLSFPICPAIRKSQDCKVDCRGLTAGRARAAQYKYRATEKKAIALQKKYKC
jgi:hypothetical protein